MGRTADDWKGEDERPTGREKTKGVESGERPWLKTTGTRTNGMERVRGGERERNRGGERERGREIF